MESYLSNRKQFISINGTDSESFFMKYGVLQGRILGPLLFIIYINDIPETASFAKFILHADDENIILTADTIEEIDDQLQILIVRLVDWVDSYGLALNLKNHMIFSRSRRLELPNPLKIMQKVIEDKTET